MGELEKFFWGSAFEEEIEILESELKESDKIILKGCEIEQTIYNRTDF